MMRRLLICGLATLTVLCGCQRDVSGSYLAVDEVTVGWLQLVRTPDDHVTGQIVFSVLKPDGQIEHNSLSLNGAVNGENITLTGGGLFGAATTTFAGTFSGKSITLSGTQATPFTLNRADLAAYQAKLFEQTTKAKAIISANDLAAKRQQEAQVVKSFITEVQKTIEAIQHFDAEADVHLGRFPNAERGYESITAKVRGYVERERQLVGKPNRAADRSQLDVAATQASLSTDQFHYQGEALKSSFDGNISPLEKRVSTFEQECRQKRFGDLTPSVCNRLLEAAPEFHQKYSAMTTGLNHLEDMYRHEKEAQTRLLAEADKMQ